MHLVKTPILLGLLLLLTIFLTACGGGSSGDDNTTTNTNGDETTQDDSQQNSGGTPTDPPDDNTPDAPIPVDDAPTPVDNNTQPPTDNNSPNESADSVNGTPATPPESTNQPPLVKISAVQGATSGQTVTLDGSASSDPDGDTLTFIWTQTQGEDLSLLDVSNPTLSFIAPNVTQSTSISFQLSVNDGRSTASASVNILVTPPADTTAPTVISRSPQANATGVLTTTTVSVTFDEALQEDLIDNQSLLVSLQSSPLAGTVSYDNTTNTLTTTLDSTLLANTTYTVTLANDLQDPAGNPLVSISWDFTTGSAYNLGETTQVTIDQCMNISDKQMLTLVNNARAITRICGTTEYAAVPALAWHCTLESAAQAHSLSMADNDFFSHTGLDGSSPGDRITALGYSWRAYAENIAAGYSDQDAAMAAWLASPGHCANIMNGQVTEMGAGVAVNDASQYRIYWTQDFGDR
jgi:uncharacterized protein YkwD